MIVTIFSSMELPSRVARSEAISTSLLLKKLFKKHYAGIHLRLKKGEAFCPHFCKNEIVLSPEPPSIDAATLLPIDLGYLSLSSNYSVSNFNTVVSDLNRSGGLARFPDDLYHYSEYLYDSSGPEPPWIITTLFEALYLEKIGKVNEALNILYWTYDHSQNGLLPEALDPNTLYPLPTTSPLTWSSAMFVIDALNYPSTANNETNASITIIILLIVIVLAVIIIISLFMTRRRRK